MKYDLKYVQLGTPVTWKTNSKVYFSTDVQRDNISMWFDSGLVYVKENDGTEEMIIPLTNVASMKRKDGQTT